MSTATLFSFLFPPVSTFVLVLSIISFAAALSTGLSEIRGKHLQYSKSWNFNSQSHVSAQKRLASKTGMILAYTGAFLVALVSFWILPHPSFRDLIIKTALTLHFFKRILEVLFVHKYSGNMALDTEILISLCYFPYTAIVIYDQYLTQQFDEPPIDLKYHGIAIFSIGISGNFYHHFLLSKLREKGEKEYKIPNGGLFKLVVCPHYLFEIIEFWGISFISQTLYAWLFAAASTFYLMARSFSTRKWYLSKFEDFPNNVKALIPFVF